MIRVTRLNGQSFILNCDLIKTLEATPDTVITLTQGEKLMVKESPEEIIRRVIEFRRQLYIGLPSLDKSSDESNDKSNLNAANLIVDRKDR